MLSPDMAAVLSFTALAGVAALADIVGGLLALRLRPRAAYSRYIIAFSAGVILAAAFFEMTPEAFEAGTAPRLVVFLMAGGFFGFYVVEKIVMLHACGEHECETHGPTAVSVAGMAADNIVDGIGIAVGFLLNPLLGLIITLAVAAHEVPQGLASAQILRKLKYSRRSILTIVSLAGVMYIIGALLSLVVPGSFYVLVIPFVAGGFLYVGSADLLAEAHRRFNHKVVASVVTGAIFMFLLITFAEGGPLPWE